MNSNKNTLSITEEIIINNIKGKIFLRDINGKPEIGVLFSKLNNKSMDIIKNEEISFFFMKSMKMSMNKLINKDCVLVSQSMKFIEEVQENKFLISESKVTKQTKNLTFLTSKLFYDKNKIIAFSNSIWQNLINS